jgi:hypothetical protein
MEEMKWFSSAMLGVLAANSLGFGLKSAKFVFVISITKMYCLQ